MGKTNRLKLGILFNISSNWLGGVYYIINLVKALDTLDDDQKPEIHVFYNKELKDFARQIEYSYLTLKQWDFESPFIGYLKSWVTGKNAFTNEIIKRFDLDGIYPVRNQPLPVDNAYNKEIKSVSVFFDLQHKYYPEFFSRKQLIMREMRFRLILKNANELVVSSNATRNDFQKLYSLRDDLKIHVLNFVSIIDDFNFTNIKILRKKYVLPDQYFIISNQFYEHKNHSVLLRALAELKQRGYNIHFAITGKMPKKKSPYIESLRNLVNKYELNEMVSFLGVIPRQDQLGMMKNAMAVIQPSLFEGWSTVIEDAKSLQVPVIASNLDVHIEQLGDAGIFFDPHKEKELADILSTYEKKENALLYPKYENRVKEFAEKFVNIFD